MDKSMPALNECESKALFNPPVSDGPPLLLDRLRICPALTLSGAATIEIRSIVEAAIVAFANGLSA